MNKPAIAVLASLLIAIAIAFTAGLYEGESLQFEQTIPCVVPK